MKEKLRKLVLLTVMFLFGSVAMADSKWPTRSVRLVVPTAPGTAMDSLARSFSDALSQNLDVPVVVENRPGANGLLAINSLLNASADGYTVFLAGNSQLSINPLLYKDLPYDPLTDFEGAGVFAETSFVTIASEKLALRTFGDLITLARSDPGKYAYASVGIGNSTHLATELVKDAADIDIQHVPFNSSQYISSVVAGDTPLMTAPPGSVFELIKSGKLTALAVTGTSRIPELAEVPTYRELGYDLDFTGWTALVFKKGVAPDIVQKMNAAMNASIESPVMKKQLATQFWSGVIGPSGAVKEYTERDTARLEPLVKKLGIAQ